jgi:hypothetical protein
MDVDDEREALKKANRDIGTARERIARQEALIVELEHDGHSTSAAVTLLNVLKETLEAMLDYRATIVEQIERLSQASKRD